MWAGVPTLAGCPSKVLCTLCTTPVCTLYPAPIGAHRAAAADCNVRSVYIHSKLIYLAAISRLGHDYITTNCLRRAITFYSSDTRYVNITFRCLTESLLCRQQPVLSRSIILRILSRIVERTSTLWRPSWTIRGCFVNRAVAPVLVTCVGSCTILSVKRPPLSSPYQFSY